MSTNSSTITRRRLIGATSATGLVGAALAVTPSTSLAATAGGKIEFVTPFRLQDSRVMEPDKYDTSARDSLAVDGIAGKLGVILNVTVTETEGAGFFRIADGFEDDPTTSNINWYTDGQTLANMAIVSTSGLGIDVQGGGSGRAHLVIDVLGFIAPDA